MLASCEDLSAIRGARLVRHSTSSSIDYHTLTNAGTNLDHEFLIGIGLTDSYLNWLRDTAISSPDE